MSEIRATTISDAAGTGPIALTGQSAAKVWIQFSTIDNPPSIKGSFNVSSLTDNNTEVEVNLTSAMSDAFFAPVGSAATSLTNPANRNLSCVCISSSVIDTEIYSTNNSQGLALCHLAAHGDLA